MPDPSAHDVLISLAEHWELQQFALSHGKDEIAVAMAAAFGACGALARSVAEEHAQARREADPGDVQAGRFHPGDAENLARLVHHTRRIHLIDHEHINPEAVLGWEELSDDEREACAEVAEAVAAAERERCAELAEDVYAIVYFTGPHSLPPRPFADLIRETP